MFGRDMKCLQENTKQKKKPKGTGKHLRTFTVLVCLSCVHSEHITLVESPEKYKMFCFPGLLILYCTVLIVIL